VPSAPTAPTPGSGGVPTVGEGPVEVEVAAKVETGPPVPALRPREPVRVGARAAAEASKLSGPARAPKRRRVAATASGPAAATAATVAG
jgi:hypothetical protein